MRHLGTASKPLVVAGGVVGSYSMRCANRIVPEANLVIYVGCSVGDQVTHNWTIPKDGTQVIQIDINPAELGRSYSNTHAILGDARTAVARLVEASKGLEPKSDWARYAHEVVMDWRREIQPSISPSSRALRPER